MGEEDRRRRILAEIDGPDSVVRADEVRSAAVTSRSSILAASGCAVTLMARPPSVEVLAVAGRNADEIAELQFTLGEGPWLDAFPAVPTFRGGPREPGRTHVIDTSSAPEIRSRASPTRSSSTISRVCTDATIAASSVSVPVGSRASAGRLPRSVVDIETTHPSGRLRRTGSHRRTTRQNGKSDGSWRGEIRDCSDADRAAADSATPRRPAYAGS